MAICTGRSREPHTGLPANPWKVRPAAPPACCGTTYSMITREAQGLSGQSIGSIGSNVRLPRYGVAGQVSHRLEEGAFPRLTDEMPAMRAQRRRHFRNCKAHWILRSPTRGPADIRIAFCRQSGTEPTISEYARFQERNRNRNRSSGYDGRQPCASQLHARHPGQKFP